MIAACRADGRCQYAIDHGAEGLGACPVGKCCMPRADHDAAMRAEFEQDANAARFFPREIDFTRTTSPSGRDVYVNSHLQSRWEGWQAATRRASEREKVLRQAVERLVKAKGRYHTEQNYKALVEALAAAAPEEKEAR
jgi:hypothetical protein